MLAKKALAGTAGAPKVYVEDVFSTYLYTGTGATQTITNNIDLSTEGGLVWIKERTSVAGAVGHQWTDTARGYEYQLRSDSTAAQTNEFNRLTSFNTNGFTLGNSSFVNANTGSWVSFSFRKAKKFFDVVTYTGNGSNRTISHNLGSVPGCIIIKDTTNAGSAWAVYHRSVGNTKFLQLQSTGAESTSSGYWNNTDPTSTEFTVGTNGNVNTNGATFVAYLFAHDAGGFGDAGSDSIIKCGSYTGAGSDITVDLGWEPQFLLIKASNTTGDWWLTDTMRGLNMSGSIRLEPNTSDAEAAIYDGVRPTSTGFFLPTGTVLNDSGLTCIYIAIRRGPMKTPTSGTSVFTPVSTSGDVSEITAGFPVDFALGKEVKNSTSYGNYAIDRLRGGSVLLETNTTGADITSQTFKFDSNTKFLQSGGGVFYGPSIYWLMRRAPGFFDVVCYTGTGSNRTVSHNLGVAPELLITKGRTSVGSSLLWLVYSSSLGNNKYLRLEQQNGSTNDSSGLLWNLTSPTSSVFSLGTGATNESGANYVAYLFASVSGVSKVGSYTGNGSSVTVTTDFQPRFILVKRTDSTGNWIVGDSARGLPTGNDPALFLNSTAAETTGQDWVDVSSTGFTVNETALNANVNTATYLYLAVA